MNEDDCEFHIWPTIPRGGQHTRTASGILALHKPTGIAVFCESERSQFKNKAEALRRIGLLLDCMPIVEWEAVLLV